MDREQQSTLREATAFLKAHQRMVFPRQGKVIENLLDHPRQMVGFYCALKHRGNFHWPGLVALIDVAALCDHRMTDDARRRERELMELCQKISDKARELADLLDKRMDLEPPRVFRRPFSLSQAALADSSS